MQLTEKTIFSCSQLPSKKPGDAKGLEGHLTAEWDS